uniref:Uncharacterized protein n=1 Tax=Meleagris gallopavo TaxID=9103 RepID=A0A803XN67_MELGA
MSQQPTADGKSSPCGCASQMRHLRPGTDSPWGPQSPLWVPKMCCGWHSGAVLAALCTLWWHYRTGARASQPKSHIPIAPRPRGFFPRPVRPAWGLGSVCTSSPYLREGTRQVSREAHKQNSVPPGYQS